MRFNVAVLPGDGVGPEVTDQAVKVMAAAAERFGHDLRLSYGQLGVGAFRESGHSWPAETVALCETSHAVLVGAVGGLVSEPIPPMGIGLPQLRVALGLAVNLRPIKLWPSVTKAGPIKSTVKSGGVDLVIVRDIGAPGSYGPGNSGSTGGRRWAESRFHYSDTQISAIVRPAFELARSRPAKRIHLVGYWSFTGAGPLWREIFDEIGSEFDDVERLYLLPDNCARLLVERPAELDVVVFDDLFRGGILVDLGAMLVGSMGFVPSAELRSAGDDSSGARGVFGVYEPAHGSVPHRAGLNQVNPTAAIMSAAMLWQISLGLSQVSEAIEQAVGTVLGKHRTYDVLESGALLTSCGEFGDRVAREVLTA